MHTCLVPALPRPFLFCAFMIQLGWMYAGVQPVAAATVDLVVNIVSDQPAYMSFDLEHFTVTVSNNGPDPATNVALVVNHPLADIPYEASATCQPVPGPNPNGPAICPESGVSATNGTSSVAGWANSSRKAASPMWPSPTRS